MSRAGYSYDIDNWALIKWRGQVASAIHGKRGQRFFRDLIAALDALPEKRLITEQLVAPGGGEFCALGSLARARGINPWKVDPDDYEGLSATFDIAEQLARETMFENDGGGWLETPEQRWQRMRAWAERQLRPDDGNQTDLPDAKDDPAIRAIQRDANAYGEGK